jgi:hypothetical protein
MMRVATALLVVLVITRVEAAKPMLFLGHGATVEQSAEQATLIAPDQPAAIIADGATRPAAEILQSQLAAITGVQCPIVRSIQAAKTQRRIVIEITRAPAHADDHGFSITADPDELRITGFSSTATQYGAWFFLMNFCDVRQVMPGDIGQVRPRVQTLTIPRSLRLLNPGPDYKLRICSGTAGLNAVAWLQDTTATQRFQYHHNIGNIYPPSKYGKSHPEYYPTASGKIDVPDHDGVANFQINFSEPSTVPVAVDYADELFRKSPQMQSVSLTVNDGLGYSESDIRAGQLTADGRTMISDPYCRYVNAVARGVKSKWPGRFVAFLPYNFTAEPPSFALEDNVLVMLFREPKVGYEQWKGKAQHFGLYLWLYGMGWVVPNHWPHALQDSLRWMREHGGIAFKGEAYGSAAHDGPKLWVMSNLLWNVDADVDALLADYFEHCYGKEAAPAVARYFQQAEKIYERRRTDTEYMLTLHHPRERQYADVTAADIDIMAQSLHEAESRVVGDGNKQRLAYLITSFKWAKLYWEPHRVIRELAAAKVASDADADAVLGAAASVGSLIRKADAFYGSDIKPAARYTIYDDGKGGAERAKPDFKWTQLDGAIDHAVGAVTAYLRASRGDAAAAEYWERNAERLPSLAPAAATERLLITAPGKPLKNLLPNSSFEEHGPPAAVDQKPGTLVAPGWPIYHNRMVNAAVMIDTAVAHSGSASLSVRGITDYSGVRPVLQLPNHRRYRLSFWYRTTSGVRSVACNIGAGIALSLPPSPEWVRHEELFTVDEGAGRTVSTAILLALRRGGTDTAQLWIDDVKLEMLAPEGLE